MFGETVDYFILRLLSHKHNIATEEDHMREFFRIQIPWRGLLFSERAMMRVRRQCHRPTDMATRYNEIVGGLNKMRYSEFLNYVRETGWKDDFLAVNTFLKSWPLLYGISNLCLKMPLLGDLVVHNVYAILSRKLD